MVGAHVFIFNTNNLNIRVSVLFFIIRWINKINISLPHVWSISLTFFFFFSFLAFFKVRRENTICQVEMVCPCIEDVEKMVTHVLVPQENGTHPWGGGKETLVEVRVPSSEKVDLGWSNIAPVDEERWHIHGLNPAILKELTCLTTRVRGRF